VLPGGAPGGVAAARLVGFACSEADGVEVAGLFLSPPFASVEASGSIFVALAGESVCVAITAASLGASEMPGASSTAAAVAAIEAADAIELAESVKFVGLVRASLALADAGTEVSSVCDDVREAAAASMVAVCWLAASVAAAVAVGLVETVRSDSLAEFAEPELFAEPFGGEGDLEPFAFGVPRVVVARTSTSPLGGTTGWFAAAPDPEPLAEPFVLD
jgi:hypothetical protein